MRDCEELFTAVVVKLTVVSVVPLWTCNVLASVPDLRVAIIPMLERVALAVDVAKPIRTSTGRSFTPLSISRVAIMVPLKNRERPDPVANVVQSGIFITPLFPDTAILVPVIRAIPCCVHALPVPAVIRPAVMFDEAE